MSEESNKDVNEAEHAVEQASRALKEASQVLKEMLGNAGVMAEPASMTSLSPEDFRSILERIDALGLTWTADLPPLIKPKNGDKGSVLFSNEYKQIQQQYPGFPRELGLVMYYTLTGSERIVTMSGNDKATIEAKAAAVRELLITSEYKGEFFFKYAIKVPYLVDVDWEVVIKAFERNVQEMPQIPYALLSLVFRQPVDPHLPVSFETAEREAVTVAVNEHLIDLLLNALADVKSKLREARRLATSLSAEGQKSNEQ